MSRSFQAQPAKRERVPLWLGLFGPSGGGKTFSALRLATGIASLTGGDIYVIDTEARRALHYAEHFHFRHIDFGAPFGSLDYFGAVRHCVDSGAAVVVVDSMSHEHEGPGGYLQFAEQEIARMAGDDYAKRERVKMAAWIKPSAQRHQMLNGLLQLNTNIIMCFRSKEKTRPMKQQDGKTKIVEMGFMPIAGDALVYEMTACALLMPQAKGVPTWQSEHPGERQMMKLPLQFETILEAGKRLSEDVGRDMARWARGAVVEAKLTVESQTYLQAVEITLSEAAALGMTELKTAWQKLDEPTRDALKSRLASEWKPIAAKMDAANESDRSPAN